MYIYKEHFSNYEIFHAVSPWFSLSTLKHWKTIFLVTLSLLSRA